MELETKKVKKNTNNKQRPIKRRQKTTTALPLVPCDETMSSVRSGLLASGALLDSIDSIGTDDEPEWPGQAPVIDMASDEDLAQKVDGALRHWGLFLVQNHGVPQELIDRLWAYTRALHALPEDEKMKMGPKLGHMGYEFKNENGRFENAFPEHTRKAQHNQWPEEVPGSELEGFRSACVEYGKAVNLLGQRLLPLLEEAIKLPKGFLTDGFKDALYFINLRHYPDRGGQRRRMCSIPPHTDSGVLTFLPQQSKPGFEICLPNGRWVPIGVPDGASNGDGGGKQKTWFLVQAGDCLRRWTNHRYVSALHRVVPWQGQGDRYAMPLFWGPGETFLMRCMPGCSSESNPERYPDPISYHDYMTGFDAGKYTTMNSLTPAQVVAAKENRIE